MAKKIFINLPISDLAASMAFYTELGFSNNPTFTDETAACMVLSEEIYVMLLTKEKFLSFTNKQIADTKNFTAAINTLSVDTPAEVNTMADKALKAGGSEPHSPMDYGFMQQRSFTDLDGHHWEVIFMDMSKFPG